MRRALLLILSSAALAGCKETITSANVSLYSDPAAPVVLGDATLQIPEGIAAGVSISASLGNGRTYGGSFTVIADDPGVLGVHEVRPTGSCDSDGLYLVYGEAQGTTTLRVKPCTADDDGEGDIAVTVVPNTTM